MTWRYLPPPPSSEDGHKNEICSTSNVGRLLKMSYLNLSLQTTGTDFRDSDSFMFLFSSEIAAATLPSLRLEIKFSWPQF